MMPKKARPFPHPCRGGATFTMVIFVMLLISSGLMYYYFHRTKELEQELSSWKSGTRKPEESVARIEPAGPASTPKPRRETFREMAARLAGTPATQPIEADQDSASAVPEKENVEEPEETPVPAAMSTPRAPSDAKSPPLLNPRTLDLGETADVGKGIQSDAPSPGETDSVPPRSTPSPRAGTTSDEREAEEIKTTENSTSRSTPPARQRPIRSMYDVTEESAAQAEPTVRVRAPRRTPRTQ